MTSTHVLTGNTIILVTFHLDKSPTKVLALNSTQLFIFSVATWLLTPQKHKKMYCLKSVLHRMKLFFFFFFLKRNIVPAKSVTTVSPVTMGHHCPVLVYLSWVLWSCSSSIWSRYSHFLSTSCNPACMWMLTVGYSHTLACQFFVINWFPWFFRSI